MSTLTVSRVPQRRRSPAVADRRPSPADPWTELEARVLRWDERSRRLPGPIGWETWLPGSMRLATRLDDGIVPPLRWGHSAETSPPIGRIVELWDDGIGPMVRAELRSTGAAQDAAQAIADGMTLGEVSIEFRAVRSQLLDRHPQRAGHGQGEIREGILIGLALLDKRLRAMYPGGIVTELRSGGIVTELRSGGDARPCRAGRSRRAHDADPARVEPAARAWLASSL